MVTGMIAGDRSAQDARAAACRVRRLSYFALVLILSATAAGISAASTTRVTPSTLIAAFKNAGIPIGTVVIYTASSDRNHLLGRPGQYVAKANWSDRRHASDGTDLGTVEIFSSKSDLSDREGYIKLIEKGNPMLEQYIHASGFVLMRLDYALTPTQAAQYARVLARVAG